MHKIEYIIVVLLRIFFQLKNIIANSDDDISNSEYYQNIIKEDITCSKRVCSPNGYCFRSRASTRETCQCKCGYSGITVPVRNKCLNKIDDERTITVTLAWSVPIRVRRQDETENYHAFSFDLITGYIFSTFSYWKGRLDGSAFGVGYR